VTSNFKIFFQIGAIVFLALLAAFLTAQAKPWTEKILSGAFGHSSKNSIASSTLNVEINEEDPTFLSGFSRVYSYNPGGIDVESEDNALIVPAITGPLTAQEYIVLDLHSGAILENKNIDTVAPIASLTKLVTAEVSRQTIQQNKEIVITDAMLAAYGTNGHFRLGETISAGELLYPLLLVSSNDAAEALAQGYESNAKTSRKDFIRAMNDWVHSIGAYRTDFYDPSGLSPYTVSSARNQATILQWIYKNDPALIAITEMRSATVRLHTWTNATHFLNLSNYEGGKDGFIPEAGETAASLFSANANTSASSSPPRYLVVVLGSVNRDNDVMYLLKKVEGK
jgi:D-alanyl-D-alanine endopeptidase (penicillin-binding protein 7)